MSEVSEQQVKDAPVALFKKRNVKTKSTLRKRASTPPAEAPSDESDDYTSEDEQGHRIKRRKKGGIPIGSSSNKENGTSNFSATKFAADGTTTIVDTNDATKQSNWHATAAPNDVNTKELLGRRTNNVDTAPDGVYRGSASYSSFIQKNPNAPDRKIGPVKAAANVRTITTTDFAPDVCKDYKQTGWCGFGDTCKFVHQREDYAQGWELDREWEINTKGKKISGTTVSSANRNTRNNGAEGDVDAEDAMLEKIPFACVICKEPYRNPIMTKCGHYFCEKCAFARYKKNPSCAICGADTRGIFNGARQLNKLLDKKRHRAQQRKAEESGEDASDGEET